MSLLRSGVARETDGGRKEPEATPKHPHHAKGVREMRKIRRRGGRGRMREDGRALEGEEEEARKKGVLLTLAITGP